MYYTMDFASCSLLNTPLLPGAQSTIGTRTPTSPKSHENTKDCSFSRETLHDEWTTSDFHVP